jgi:hypothetical protein
MTQKNPYFFEEGQTYPFKVGGKILLPPDDEEYLVLQSYFGSKHLLKYNEYQDYGLVKNIGVNCRIDKISCSGRIYLEPEHKDYKEGNIYGFKMLGFEEILNSEEKAERFLRLEDLNGHTAFVNIGEHTPRDFSDQVFCRVDRIKKGKLYLSLSQTDLLVSKLETGKTYEFLITGLVTLAEDEEYYVLLDEFEELHYMRKKYFEDYGFTEGDTIKCNLLGKPKLFRHYLEPEHPFYRIGESYDFFVSGTDVHTDEFGKQIAKLMVRDGSGKEYFADCDELISKVPKTGMAVKCRVDSIRMSKLLLKCV